MYQITFILILECAGLLILISALPLVKVEISISAPGLITSFKERIPILAPADGYIKEVNCRENQSVKNGDALVVTESRVLLEKIALNSAQRKDIQDQMDDIVMLVSLLGGKSFFENDDTLFTVAKIEKFKTAQYLGQYDLLCSQVWTNNLKQEKCTREYKRSITLHHNDLLTDHDLEESKFALDSAKADKQQIMRESLSRWRADQLSLQTALTTNYGESAQLTKQLDYYTIRSPHDGVLMGFGGLAVGYFVIGGTKLGELSPTGELMVDAYVTPKDIGFIRIGQSAYIQVDSFPFTEWGSITGTVIEISPDLLQLNQQFVFKVIIKINTDTLESSSTGIVHVVKGMTTKVQFLMQPRTLLQLLYQKTSEWLDPRISEKHLPII